MLQNQNYIMNFGKYRGEEIQKIFVRDKGYINWMKGETKLKLYIYDGKVSNFKK